ncbi:hypothetical protein HDU76_011952 [Blyttiomyces sp. JEL0837]|nr:hypothetical protein HDU76_011952 [Blyttiomyces sp. JEL0837]
MVYQQVPQPTPGATSNQLATSAALSPLTMLALWSSWQLNPTTSNEVASNNAVFDSQSGIGYQKMNPANGAGVNTFTTATLPSPHSKKSRQQQPTSSASYIHSVSDYQDEMGNEDMADSGNPSPSMLEALWSRWRAGWGFV